MKKNGVKRTFKDLRIAILICLYSKQKTINQISHDTGINWKSVELHLTYLMGKGLVSSVFSSKYVRIFELSENGKYYVKLFWIDSTIKNERGREIKL